MDNLTVEEKLCNYETIQHARFVQKILNHFATDMMRRGERHDDSKMKSPEVEVFTEYTPKLKALKYGTDEYKTTREEMKPALDHHYANNSHHPQFFKNGIDDMSLLDIMEMFADWYASSKRQNNGNIRHSLEVNKKDYNVSEQLNQIFENTIDFIEDIK